MTSSLPPENQFWEEPSESWLTAEKALFLSLFLISTEGSGMSGSSVIFPGSGSGRSAFGCSESSALISDIG